MYYPIIKISIQNIILLAFTFSFCGCLVKGEKLPAQTFTEEYVVEEIAVEYDNVKVGTLEKERIQNGKIRAFKKVVVKSEAEGVINDLNIYPGKKLKKGDLIFQADTISLSFMKRKYEIDLREALITKKDKLISSKNLNGDKTSNANIEKTIDILSGYLRAETQLEEVNHQIEKQSSWAPFSGTVADVEIEEFEVVSIGQEICKLISDQNFLVEFNLIENLVSELKIGQKVKVKPLLSDGNKEFTAKIVRINPIVDKNGLVKVYAQISSSALYLIDGMNVQLTLIEKVRNQLIIPKEAVVRRSDRNVVFTIDTTSMLAKWNYVDVLDESEYFYSIGDGLKLNDKVIISNNLFLENNSKVSIN